MNDRSFRSVDYMHPAQPREDARLGHQRVRGDWTMGGTKPPRGPGVKPG